MHVPWLIVFDLDGTLIDSSLDLCLSVNAALEHVGHQPLPHKLIAGYIGDGAAVLIRRALGDPADPAQPANPAIAHHDKFEQAFAFFLPFYRRHKLDNTRLYDGVLSSLASLRQSAPATLMAVLTNKPVGPSREICDALGLTPFLFAIYGGDSFASKKPDPVGLHWLIEEARALARKQNPHGTFDSRHAWMVGDSAVDILTAKRAGTRSLGCRYGLAPETLEPSQPDLLCDSPADWPRLLDLMGAA